VVLQSLIEDVLDGDRAFEGMGFESAVVVGCNFFGGEGAGVDAEFIDGTIEKLETATC